MAKITIETNKHTSVYGMTNKQANEIEDIIIKKWEKIIKKRLFGKK